MIDEEIVRLHQAGIVTGAIAVRLSVESSYVRQVVGTHLEAVAEASKPHYASKAERQRAQARNRAQAKLDKAQRAFERAKAALADMD